MKYLVTGAAGFIGYSLCRRLLEEGHEVFGIDNLSDSYSPIWKRFRLDELKGFPRFYFQTADLNRAELKQILPATFRPEILFHLAAESGVRRSLNQPARFLQSNISGFGNAIEFAAQVGIKHFVFASSSSVYGDSTPLPAEENQPLGNPLSTYAATKRANEMLAYVYARHHKLPCTGLRLFSVYGPWGRPDMCYFQFATQILQGTPIPLYAEGTHSRDFTYIDDAVEAICRLSDSPPSFGKREQVPYRVVNVGTGSPVQIGALLHLLERALQKKAITRKEPRNAIESLATQADITLLKKLTNYSPTTSLETGLNRFLSWFQQPRVKQPALQNQALGSQAYDKLERQKGMDL